MATGYEVAQRQIGLNEGEKKAALQDFLTTGGQNLDPATTAWCAAFVNAAEGGGTGKLNARSYLDYGEEVVDPQTGDIVVLSRGDPNGWQGHVGYFQGYDDEGNIQVLGGNQGDAVSVASYSPDRLLGYRRSPGVGANASANNGGAKKGGLNEDDGPGYKELPFGIFSNAQAGLADKIGGERMAGMGRGMMGLSQQLMNGSYF